MSKQVAVAQTEQFRKMANEKGIGRDCFQTDFLANGTASRVLDAIKEGLPITIGNPLVAPPGGRLHIVRVRVVLDRSWSEAVNAAGPNTPEVYNVRKVGDLYMPTEKGGTEEDLILLNYPKGEGSWDKAHAWAKQFKLRDTDPRRVFGIGECHPNFNQDVHIDPTYVVATKSCTFDGGQQACYVHWYGSDRKAVLFRVEYFGSAHGWFAFRK